PSPMSSLSFSGIVRHSPPPPLSPYTTLFRSVVRITPATGSAPGEAARAERRSPHHGQALRLLGRPRREGADTGDPGGRGVRPHRDRKSTRLNSSHVKISYAVFCLKKKNNKNR